MELYERFKNNLGKLKRNEEQMTEEQKKKYAAPLKKLKSEIAADASELMKDFLVSGCRLLTRDKDTADWKGFIRATDKITEEWISQGGNREVAKVLWKIYDIDAFFTSLLPLHYKIWYEAYGPYWLAHCTPTFEDEYTFTNDIIEMEWWAKHNEWAAVKMEDGKKVTDYEKGVTIMLPPTQELLEKRYKEDLEALAS